MDIMSKTFNATCAGCRAFKPRCVRVRLRVLKRHSKDIVALCEDCRRETYKGRYRLEDGGHK